MFRTVSSFLLNESVRMYTTSPQIVDIIDPFVKVAQCVPSGGLIPLPQDYRNLLGAPSININQNKNGECKDSVPITTVQQFQAASLRGGCLRRPIAIVSQSEFDYLTTSKYKAPTYDNPIAYFAGKKALKVCPYDISMVTVLYVVNEPLFNYAYTVQPDDTYVQNPSDPSNVESIWGNTAFPHLLKGLTHLYAAYSRDRTFSDFATLLSEISIV